MAGLADLFDETRPRVANLLKRGLLPESLPPIFSASRLFDIPLLSGPTRYLVTKKRRAHLAGFNASKRGQQRRMFGIPHPLFHHDACHFFDRNWDPVAVVLASSTGSASKPVFSAAGFRAVSITPQGKLPAIRLQTLARKRFCLVTDVSRCFPSIYTHAIPWALDGRTAAKAERSETSATVRGNRLDFIIRQAQDGQTIGVPVGPDTSRLISELILSRVDAEYLQAVSKPVYYVRHVDDYWIGGDTIEECESHLHRLRTGLAAYQLDINEAKTRILPLAQAIGEAWPSELKKDIKAELNTNWGRIPALQDVTALLSRIIDRALAAQDDGIIKFAIRQIDRAKAWDARWDILEPFLAQAAVQFPHCFDYVARVIAWRARLDDPIDKNLWRDVILSVAGSAASLGHDSELVWALWLMKELGQKVTKRQLDQYTSISGPLVLSLLAHMTVQGLTTRPSFLEDLQTRAVGDDQFTGAMWPLSLELYHLGHHAVLDAHRPPGNELLAAWHAAKASLLDWSSMPRVFERDDGEEDESWEPDYAIEDYSSSYDDEDEVDESEEDEGGLSELGDEPF